MIGFLRGEIFEKNPNHVILDVGGVGYQLSLSSNSFAKLPKKGETATVQTYMHVREDDIQLFGFYDFKEKDLFKKLISVSSIGPKVALSVLSSMKPDKLIRAIISGDADLITSVPGIGKKTAQRVILELKEKLTDSTLGEEKLTDFPIYVEARDALIGLGYSMQESSRALDGCDDNMSAEECIKMALKNLGG